MSDWPYEPPRTVSITKRHVYSLGDTLLKSGVITFLSAHQPGGSGLLWECTVADGTRISIRGSRQMHEILRGIQAGSKVERKCTACGNPVGDVCWSCA